MKPSTEDEGLSVDVRRLLEDPANPVTVLAEHPGHGLAQLVARTARDLGLEVEHDPLPHNEAHASIVGFTKVSKTQAKRKQRRLAEAAAWIQMPEGALSV